MYFLIRVSDENVYLIGEGDFRIVCITYVVVYFFYCVNGLVFKVFRISKIIMLVFKGVKEDLDV